jgi:hypothetical protein
MEHPDLEHSAEAVLEPLNKRIAIYVPSEVLRMAMHGGPLGQEFCATFLGRPLIGGRQ